MLIKGNRKRQLKTRRALRVRKSLKGTKLKPRLSVKKTNKHLFVQIIDDENGTTLAATSTVSKEFKGTEFAKKGKASAKRLGEVIAEKALAANIKDVIFDRGASKYHGLLKELANEAREKGLKF